MQKDENAGSAELTDEYSEEVCDTLIAISVVAKRLAKEMIKKHIEKEKSNVQELRADGTDRQG